MKKVELLTPLPRRGNYFSYLTFSLECKPDDTSTVLTSQKRLSRASPQFVTSPVNSFS